MVVVVAHDAGTMALQHLAGKTLQSVITVNRVLKFEPVNDGIDTRL